MVETGPEQPTYTSLTRSMAEASPEAPRRRAVVPWLLTAASVAFALGILANPWFERNIRSHLPGATAVDTSGERSVELAALQNRIAVLESHSSSASTQPALNDPLGNGDASGQASQLEASVEGVAQTQADVERRLGDLQAQVADLRSRADASMSAVAEGAERAQTVLLVTALRRTLDAGQRADALEPALRARFGDSHPGEVSAVSALGRAPVTIAQLRQELQRLRPVVEESIEPSGGNWWSSFKQGLTSVIAVRREDDPANPAARIAQASLRLSDGDVDGAAAQVAALPPASRRATASWVATARRRAAAMHALDRLEIAALTPPVTAATPSPTPL